MPHRLEEATLDTPDTATLPSLRHGVDQKVTGCGLVIILLVVAERQRQRECANGGSVAGVVDRIKLNDLIAKCIYSSSKDSRTMDTTAWNMSSLIWFFF